MLIKKFHLTFRYGRRSQVLLVEASLFPALDDTLSVFAFHKISAALRTIIIRPKFLFFLVLYLLRAPRVAASLAAYIRSHGIPVVIAMDFVDVQLSTRGRETSLFAATSSLLRRTDFFLVQHGWQLVRRDPAPRSSRVTLLTFGTWTADHFPSFGRSESAFVPIGSLVLSRYLDKRCLPVPKRYSVCLVSSVRSEEFLEVEGDRAEAYDALVALLGRFLLEFKIEVIVALTNRPDVDKEYDHRGSEVNWFRRRLGDLVSFTNPLEQLRGEDVSGGVSNQVVPVWDRFATFEASDQSVVTIGGASTVLWESFARGNRILAVNCSHANVFDFPVDGIWSLKIPSYQDFRERLLSLLHMSDEHWSSLSDCYRDRIITLDPEISASSRLQAHLYRAISLH